MHKVVMKNVFALNHDKRLQIHLYVKCQPKNAFPKDLKITAGHKSRSVCASMQSDTHTHTHTQKHIFFKMTITTAADNIFKYFKYLYIFLLIIEYLYIFLLLIFQIFIYISINHRKIVCLRWGSTAQLTQWGHVSLTNNTFTGHT